MSDYRHQIREALEAVRVGSDASFSWRGKRVQVVPPRVKQALTAAGIRRYLLSGLQLRLYTSFYCQGGVTLRPNVTDAASAVSTSGLTPFTAALSEANAGRGSWDDGWQVLTVGHDAVTVHKDGLTVESAISACTTPAGGTPVPGERVLLRLPKEMLGVAPGFYMAVGEIPLGGEGSMEHGDPSIRLYWHLSPEGAASLVSSVTTALNGAGIAFRLKVLAHPALYNRCDAGVLYLRRRDYAMVHGKIERIYAAVADSLNPRVPALTKLLAPGLGLAEDPGNGESFGQNRCRLLAEALLQAHDKGWRSSPARLTMVRERFHLDGVPFEEPYLSGGSHDRYMLVGSRRAAGRSEPTHDVEPLEAATAEGRLELAGDALAVIRLEHH